MLGTIGRSLALFVVLLQASPAFAGQAYGLTFSCDRSRTTANATTCVGSLRAAHVSPNATDYAQFRVDGSGYLYFSASYKGVRYACNFDLASSRNLAAAALAGDYNTYFYVHVEDSGRCSDTAFLENSSTFQALPKP